MWSRKKIGSLILECKMPSRDSVGVGVGVEDLDGGEVLSHVLAPVVSSAGSSSCLNLVGLVARRSASVFQDPAHRSNVQR